MWANQIACRIALLKGSDYGSVQVREVGVAVESIVGPEWNPKSWRRWMRIVFAPWVKGTGDMKKGVEFEIWNGGVRAVSKAVAQSQHAT